MSISESKSITVPQKAEKVRSERPLRTFSALVNSSTSFCVSLFLFLEVIRCLQLLVPYGIRMAPHSFQNHIHSSTSTRRQIDLSTLSFIYYEIHLTMLSGYYWLCSQELFLAGLRGSYGNLDCQLARQYNRCCTISAPL